MHKSEAVIHPLFTIRCNTDFKVSLVTISSFWNGKMKCRRTISIIIAAGTLLSGPFAGASERNLPPVANAAFQIDRGNYLDAAKLLATALRKNPGDLEARRLLATALIGAGEAAAALRQLKALNKVAPGDSRDYVLMAEASYHMGDTSNAIRHYRKALELDPSSGCAGMGLSRALMSAGKIDEAITVCHEALRLARDAPTRQQFVDLLSTMRKRVFLAHRQLCG